MNQKGPQRRKHILRLESWGFDVSRCSSFPLEHPSINGCAQRKSTQTKPRYFFCGISNMIPLISREYRQNNPSPRWGRLHTKESAATSRRCCRTRRRRSRRATINCWRIGSSRVRQIPIPDLSAQANLRRTWIKPGFSRAWLNWNT